jgi:hypothetical protein
MKITGINVHPVALDTKIFLTHCERSPGVHYVFMSLRRTVSKEECEALYKKYSETHQKGALPGEALWVDLRPAFQKPLSDVTSIFRLGPIVGETDK